MYKTLKPFKAWCQAVLPLIYDDSLSYYELLCQVITALNEVIKELKHIDPLISEIINNLEKLKKYVDDKIAGLDEQIDQEIEAYLDDMIQHGVFADILIDDETTSLTKTWSSTKISDELANATSIDDTTTSVDSTWSSNKISSELSSKADASAIPTKTSDLTNDSGFISFIDITRTLEGTQAMPIIASIITDNRITVDSTIEIYTSDFNIVPTDVVVTDGRIEFTWDSVETTFYLKVRIS